MTPLDAAPVVLLVTPPGTHRPEPLAAAVRAAHPDWQVRPVWAGDPHLRPVLDGAIGWADPEGEQSVLRQGQLVTSSPHVARWQRTVAAVRAARADGAAHVVVLAVGAVAVLGPIDSLLARDAPARLVPRAGGPLDDELAPAESELVANGSWSTSAMAFGPDAGPLLDWLDERFASAPLDASVGPVLDRAAVAFALERCDDERIGVGPFRWSAGDPVLLDVPGFVTDEPWSLDPSDGRRARVDVAGRPDREAVVRSAVPQLAGELRAITAPGGLEIDDAVRALARAAAARGDTVPAAWSEPQAWRAWLEPRYWDELHARRRDLAAAFAQPRGRDAAAFRDWARRAFVDDRVAPVIGVPAASGQHWGRAESLGDGVNVVGYLTRESSLGDVARRLCDGLAAAGVALSRLAVQRTASPEVPHAPAPDDVIAHRHTLAVVNADQLPALELDHPELFAAGTRLVGYWFWELEHVPRTMRRVAAQVDEIWVGSRFVADALRAAVDTPVRHVPVPVAPPVASDRTRQSFPQLAGLGDRFVFAVVFDHFSVTERKNPVGAIEAFRRAFAPGEGPVLVVKSMNAARRWPQHQHVVAAASGRDDIVLWDEHLSRDDHMAFIRGVDALVSLHRSEGLGLHLAEAMWLGTPVVATRYSGNLDFTDDDCALLVDATLTPVVRGEGVYPPEARWADPDLDRAAAAMRRLVDDPALGARLAAAARERMERQPTLADTGRTIAGLLGLPHDAAGRVAS